MTIRMFHYISFFISFPLFVSCQNYSENSMATDELAQVKCPANGCSNQAPNGNDLSVKYTGPSQVFVPANQTNFQMGGDCYTSTYPDNRLDVKVYNKSSNAQVTAQVYNINASDQSTLRCIRGRYNLTISTAGMDVGGTYLVRIQIQGLNGQEVVTNNVSRAEVTIARTP